MKKLLILIALVGLQVGPAHAATAYWTGQMEYVTTVTYKSGVRCQYNYAGNSFWRTFSGGSCPSSIQVQ